MEPSNDGLTIPKNCIELLLCARCIHQKSFWQIDHTKEMTPMSPGIQLCVHLLYYSSYQAFASVDGLQV